MKFHQFKPLAAFCFLALISLHPASALTAASDALAQWALSVAPSLLPFLIAVPALTSPEVCALLARFSGGLLSFFRLPKNASGALLIGWLSGSPAGSAALSSVACDPTDPPGAFLRAALMASGASPAFLLTGIAVSMLNAPETGPILLRSQLLSVFLTALLLRSFGSSRPSASSPSSHASQSAVLSAMLTLLSIAGYMALFSALARQLSLFLSPAFEMPLLALFELAGGCRALASLPVATELCLPLISAASCFGGISVFAQCMSFLAPLGVDGTEYAAGKLLQSAFAALMTFLQLEAPKFGLEPSLFPLLALCFLLSAIFIRTCLLRTVCAHSHDHTA